MHQPNLADRSDSCLVIIDMQEPFLRTMFDRETVTESTGKLAAAAGILNIPVLVTLQNPERMGGTVPEVVEGLPPHEPISKFSFSCCGEPAFVSRLETLCRNTVILCGVEAHICVSQTALDLVARGYRVYVPEDAVCSRRERDFRLAMDRMRQAGVIVTSTEAVIFELLGCAGSDEFREILKIVK